MRRTLIALCIVLTACGGESGGTSLPPTSVAGTAATSTSAAPPAASTTTSATAAVAPAAFEGLALVTEAGRFFSGSGACAVCHQAMVDGEGRDVSIDSFWRSTMMANAARDPYWIATVRSEVDATPSAAALIEDKCSACHMPMARTTAVFEGDEGSVLDAGFADAGHPLAGFAADGVSCTLCHQVQSAGLGEAASFSGGYPVDGSTPQGERLLYGPYDVGLGPATAMLAVSGFDPVLGPQVQDSALCATCHTLFTPALDADGRVVGEFAEQTPYLEWEASAFAASTSCQGCHMPVAPGAVQLAVTGGGPARAPFSEHRFVGGNTFMVSVFRSAGPDLGVTASSAHFDATLERIVEQLTASTASVAVSGATAGDGSVAFEVTVGVATGHKFPTGYPSRRAWLHVTVAAADGTVVFESGAPLVDGSIAGNDNDADPAAFEPHHLLITGPGQVQIYEAIIADPGGAVTTTLLRGAGYLKDNRLLPAGFDPAAASPHVLPAGAAAGDGDFAGGSDTVAFRVDVGDAVGPFTIEVDLLFQSIGFRWIDSLLEGEGPEIARLAGLLEQVPNVPVRVAAASAVSP